MKWLKYSPQRLNTRAVLACARTLSIVSLLSAGSGCADSQAANHPASPLSQETLLSHGRFNQVSVRRPLKEPARIIIWLAGSTMPAEQRRLSAQTLRDDGALVAIVDTQHLIAAIQADTDPDDTCPFSVGDIENFSRFVQAYYHLPTYRLPILIGDGEGSALAYAIAAQSPEHLLAGLITDELCPTTLPPHLICGPGVIASQATIQPAPLFLPFLLAPANATPQCSAENTAHFANSIHAARTIKRLVNGQWLPGLRAAVRSLGAQPNISLPPPPADLKGLPIIEVNINDDEEGEKTEYDHADTFAIFVSGDGGWAGIDKEVAEGLAEAGIPVVGVDSLRYFWSRRSPSEFATDLDRLARFYQQRWKRKRIIFVGFSQGADVLPAALNHLSQDTREMTRMIVLMSLGKQADYEFHVSNWVVSDHSGLPIAPDIEKLPIATTLCIYGVDDDDSICPTLPTEYHRIGLPGDHHFNDDYRLLSRIILGQLLNQRHQAQSAKTH